MAADRRALSGDEGSSSQDLPASEKRMRVADELYDALVGGQYSFWNHVYPMFLMRDITRHDVRSLVSRGLAASQGNYRTLLNLFGMPQEDYKRFLNFLAAHDCRPDFREFRKGRPAATRASSPTADGEGPRRPRRESDPDGAEESSC